MNTVHRRVKSVREKANSITNSVKHTTTVKQEKDAISDAPTTKVTLVQPNSSNSAPPLLQSVTNSRKRTASIGASSTSEDMAEELFSTTIPSSSTSSATPEPTKTAKLKRVKAKNSTWTLEEDKKLIELVTSTLPTQDFSEYARILNKRDAQTVRYRWKVILRRSKGED